MTACACTVINQGFGGRNGAAWRRPAYICGHAATVRDTVALRTKRASKMCMLCKSSHHCHCERVYGSGRGGESQHLRVGYRAERENGGADLNVSKLPDSAEERVGGVGVGGVGGERVADLVAEGGAVFLERGRSGIEEEAS